MSIVAAETAAIYARAVEVLGISKQQLFAEALEMYLPTLQKRLRDAKGISVSPEGIERRHGELCRKCGHPATLVQRAKPPKKPGRYYFMAWLLCRSCDTRYMIDETKVVCQETPVRESTSPKMLATAPDDPNFAPRPDHIMPWD